MTTYNVYQVNKTKKLLLTTENIEEAEQLVSQLFGTIENTIIYYEGIDQHEKSIEA